jgi:hypothetical protein
MPITVSHQPDFGIVGGASYGVGQGRNRRYEDELARQEAARLRQERLQQAELAQRAKNAQQNFQMQQAEFALRAQNQGFNQDMTLAGKDWEQQRFGLEQQGLMDRQAAGFEQQKQMDLLNQGQAEQQWIVGQEATAAQETEKHHDAMEKMMFSKGFEYDPASKQKLDQLMVARGKMLADRTMTPQDYAKGIMGIAKEMATILPSKRKEPEPDFKEDFQTKESFYDERMGGTFFRSGNGQTQFVKSGRDEGKKEDNLQKALSVASKDYSDHLKRISDMEAARAALATKFVEPGVTFAAAQKKAGEVYDPQIQSLRGSLGYFRKAMEKSQYDLDASFERKTKADDAAWDRRAVEEGIAMNPATREVPPQGGVPVQGPAQAVPQETPPQQTGPNPIEKFVSDVGQRVGVPIGQFGMEKANEIASLISSGRLSPEKGQQKLNEAMTQDLELQLEQLDSGAHGPEDHRKWLRIRNFLKGQ